MKITIEPEEGEQFEMNVYEHLFEACVVGTRAGEFGMMPIRRLHSNPKSVFSLVGLLEAAKQELLALGRSAVKQPIMHGSELQCDPPTMAKVGQGI